jgi:heme A synthase
MALMGGEVLIGALIVVLGKVALDPSIQHGMFTELHAGNTFLLLAALTLTAHHLGGGPSLELKGHGPVAASLGQAFGGLALTVGTGAIAALGDTLFPATSLREGLAQDLSPGAHVFLHLRTLHPIFAIVAWVLVVGACFALRGREELTPAVRTLATWAIALASFQMLLGGLNLWLLVPIPTQLLHLALADALFITLVLTAAHALAGQPPVAVGSSIWPRNRIAPDASTIDTTNG